MRNSASRFINSAAVAITLLAAVGAQAQLPNPALYTSSSGSSGGGGGGGSPGGNPGDLQTNAGGGSFGGLTPGTGVGTWLATPSSANLAAAVTGETGTGALVFGTSPTLTTPNLGTPSAATLTNAVGLPISTGVSGLGTGVATALGVNVGSAGAFVVNGGALGTPSSGTATNLTGLPLTTGVTGILPAANGGTGINNGSNTLTLNSAVSLPAHPASTQCLHISAAGAITATGSDCGSGGGSWDITDGTHSVTGVTGLTVGNGLLVGGSAGAATLDLTNTLNTQTGASYTILTTDAGKTVQMTNGSATTVTMVDVTTAGAGFAFSLLCDAGCTVNRAGSDTINGATSLSVAAKQLVYFQTAASGTNMRASVVPANDASNATNLISGTVAAARGGAGTINGALKGNGSGTVSQAACADLSNGSTGCSTATGTSGATIPLLNGANTWSGVQTYTPSPVETAVSLSGCNGSTATIDLTAGSYFYCTVSAGAVTFAVSNPAASGKVSSFTLELTNPGSQTLTWMTGTKWPGGSQPSWTAAGVDLLVCSTRDNATTWRCVRGEADSK